MLKKDSFERKIFFTILLSFLVFIFSSLKKISSKYYHNCNSLPWAPCIFLPEQLFCLSHHKTCWTMAMYNVGLKICLLGTLNSMVTLSFFFFGVNRSGPRTSSTTNHTFHRALGRFHGPWCKQPLKLIC